MRENPDEKRRPAGLPPNAVEPRCGDFVQLRHLAPKGLFKISTTLRYQNEDVENTYGFSEVGGERAFNLSESEYVALYDTEKSARWPVVYPEVDLMHRRRDREQGGITYHGEPLDAAKKQSDGESVECPLAIIHRPVGAAAPRRVRWEACETLPDASHWRITEEHQGCTWREVGREPVRAVFVDGEPVVGAEF